MDGLPFPQRVPGTLGTLKEGHGVQGHRCEACSCRVLTDSESSHLPAGVLSRNPGLYRGPGYLSDLHTRVSVTWEHRWLFWNVLSAQKSPVRGLRLSAAL